MENFITGYAGTESQQRRALRSVLGDEGYERFFDRFLSVFFTDRDAAFLQDLGLNSVRIPFNYRHFESDDAPFEIREEGFRLLDSVVDACARHGIYAILDLHAVPGAQNQHWHSDNPTQWAHFWASAAVPGPRGQPLGAHRRPLPRQPLGGRLQPGQRAGRRGGHDDRPVLRAPGVGDPSGRSRTTSCSWTAIGTRPSSISSATRCRTACTRHTTTRCPASSTEALTRGSAEASTSIETGSRRPSSRAPSTCATAAPRSGSASSAPSTPATPRRTRSDADCSRTSSRSSSGTTRAGRSGPTRTSVCRASSRPIPRPST